MKKKTSITLAELKQLLENGKNIIVIDVRSKEEYNDKHIPFASNLPVEEIEAGNFNPESEKVVVMTCAKGGGRSERAAKHIQDNCENECYFLEGGTLGWFENEKK